MLRYMTFLAVLVLCCTASLGQGRHVATGHHKTNSFTYPLLVDLTGAWELTSGPQDSSSNAFDLTANGTVTYDIARGARLGVSQQNGLDTLYRGDTPLLRIGARPFTWCGFVRFNTLPSQNLTIAGKYDATVNFEWVLYVRSDGTFVFSTNWSNDFATSVPVTLATDTPYFVVARRDINGTMTCTANLAGDATTFDTHGEDDSFYGPFILGETPGLASPPPDAWLKYVYLWIGDTAARSDAQIEWLYNSAAGRTYQEISTYPGP